MQRGPTWLGPGLWWRGHRCVHVARWPASPGGRLLRASALAARLLGARAGRRLGAARPPWLHFQGALLPSAGRACCMPAMIARLVAARRQPLLAWHKPGARSSARAAVPLPLYPSGSNHGPPAQPHLPPPSSPLRRRRAARPAVFACAFAPFCTLAAHHMHALDPGLLAPVSTRVGLISLPRDPTSNRGIGCCAWLLCVCCKHVGAGWAPCHSMGPLHPSKPWLTHPGHCTSVWGLRAGRCCTSFSAADTCWVRLDGSRTASMLHGSLNPLHLRIRPAAVAAVAGGAGNGGGCGWPAGWLGGERPGGISSQRPPATLRVFRCSLFHKPACGPAVAAAGHGRWAPPGPAPAALQPLLHRGSAAQVGFVWSQVWAAWVTSCGFAPGAGRSGRWRAGGGGGGTSLHACTKGRTAVVGRGVGAVNIRQLSSCVCVWWGRLPPAASRRPWSGAPPCGLLCVAAAGARQRPARPSPAERRCSPAARRRAHVTGGGGAWNGGLCLCRAEGPPLACFSHI